MQIDCYHITDKPQIIPCEYDAAIEKYQQGKANVWIDILDANKEELEHQLNELQIDGLLKSFCLGASDHPGFYPLYTLSLVFFLH